MPSLFVSLLFTAIGVALLCLIWGFFAEPALLMPRRRILRLPQLPPELEGLRILFFSDIHFGRGMRARRSRRFVRKMMAEKPHLILFGGDLSENPQDFDEAAWRFPGEQLALLEAPLGKFAVTGNHDAESREAARFFSHTCDKAGFVVLENEGRRLGALRLIGLKDQFYRPASELSSAPSKRRLALFVHDRWKPEADSEPAAKLEAAYREAGKMALSEDASAGKGALSENASEGEDDAFLELLLLHEPDLTALLPPAALPRLCLSGHSHNGQITFFGLPLVREAQGRRYMHGLYRLPDARGQVFVSSGLGSVHIHARFFNPPEYLLLTLSSESLKGGDLLPD